MAVTIFEWKDWPYFGFFTLFQGFVLFGLSDWLKGKGLILFQKIALSGTLISVLLATMIEVGQMKQPELFGVALMLEGVVMLYGSTKLSESLLGVFGRIALVIGSLLLFEVSVGWGILLIALYFLGLGISFQGTIKPWEKVLSLIALIWFLLFLQIWNFDVVKDALGLKWDFLLYICPSLTALVLAYSVLKVRQGWISVVSLVHFAFWNLVLHFYLILNFNFTFSNEVWDPTQFNFIQLLIWVWVIVIYGVLIMSVFSEEKGKALVSDRVRLFVLRGGLFCATLFTLFHAAQFSEEPWTTLLWGAWAGALLWLGNAQNWKNFRYAGISVFCLIIAKLYLIDVWQWGSGTKVIAFSTLGMALLVFSFFAQKKSKS